MVSQIAQKVKNLFAVQEMQKKKKINYSEMKECWFKK